MAHIEITGWNAEGESTDGGDDVRDNETVDQAIDRVAAFWGIVEIGDVTIYG